MCYPFLACLVPALTSERERQKSTEKMLGGMLRNIHRRADEHPFRLRKDIDAEAARKTRKGMRWEHRTSDE